MSPRACALPQAPTQYLSDDFVNNLGSRRADWTRDWLISFPGRYTKFSRDARRARFEMKQATWLKGADRRSQIRIADKTAETAEYSEHCKRFWHLKRLDEAYWAEQRAKKVADRLERVRRRFEEGEVFHGGPVGGNIEYLRRAFVKPGLKSEEHPILRKFVEKLPTAKTGFMTGSDKGVVAPAEMKLFGLDDEYVTGHTMRGFLRVELDSSFQDLAALEWELRSRHIPLPNIVVGHVDEITGVLKRPHLLYVLENSVCFTKAGLPKFKALWWRVLRGLTYATLSIGGDAGALSNPMKTKNPVTNKWSTGILEEAPWTLAALKAHVRMDVSDDEMAAVQQLGDAKVAKGTVPKTVSNALFISLNEWTRDNVLTYRRNGGTETNWRRAVLEQAEAIADALGVSDLNVERTAKNVAEYSWKRSEAAANRVVLSADQLRTRQQDAGRRSTSLVADRTERRVIEAYLKLASKGSTPTKTGVAKTSGCSAPTVRKYWDAAVEAHRVRVEGGLKSRCSPVQKGYRRHKRSDAGDALSYGSREYFSALRTFRPFPYSRTQLSVASDRQTLSTPKTETPSGDLAMPAVDPEVIPSNATPIKVLAEPDVPGESLSIPSTRRCPSAQRRVTGRPSRPIPSPAAPPRPTSPPPARGHTVTVIDADVPDPRIPW